MVGVSLGKVECEHFKTGASKIFPDGNCPKDLRERECRRDICPKESGGRFFEGRGWDDANIGRDGLS